MQNTVPLDSGLRDGWRATIQRWFFVPMMVITIGLIVIGIASAWYGVALAAGAQLLMLGIIAVPAWRSAPAWPAFIVALGGVVWAATDGTVALLGALVAVAVLVVYVFWYSPNGRVASEALAVGKTFPDVEFTDLSGAPARSTQWDGAPTILLFYRGAWCPLCTTQVRQLAERYRQIDELGARVVLVSPQPAEESAKMATKFEAPMTFLVDNGNRVARQLGIQHPGGAPVGIASDAETVLPTAVVLDEMRVVRFVDETDNYRFRPDPAAFIEVLAAL